MHTLLRLATVLALFGCSPTPVGLLSVPDAHVAASDGASAPDAVLRASRDARLAWVVSDAPPLADAPPSHDDSTDASAPPDMILADDAPTPPDVPELDDATDASDVLDASAQADMVIADGDDAHPGSDAPDLGVPHGDALADTLDVPVGPICPGETSACGRECRDLRSDPQHCGACGTSCRTGDECRSGQCWGWVFRGAYVIDARPYARERDLERLRRSLDAECALRVAGSRVCSGEESYEAARSACGPEDFAWITRDRVEWLVSSEAATSLWLCRRSGVLASRAALAPDPRQVACCAFDQVAANVVANVR